MSTIEHFEKESKKLSNQIAELRKSFENEGFELTTLLISIAETIINFAFKEMLKDK